MNIYVDFDDCLCETARDFSKLVKELFGKDIPYERIEQFDLQKSFALTDEEYRVSAAYEARRTHDGFEPIDFADEDEEAFEDDLEGLYDE